MAKNKVSGQAKAAKAKAKGKGHDKGGAGGMEEREEGTKGHRLDTSKWEVDVWNIICEKQSNMEQALARLKAGENFETVGRAFSKYKNGTGGYMGWCARDKVGLIADVAFTLEVSSVTDPKIGEKKTDQGWHIVMVQGRRRIFSKEKK